jgi:hypothetical protein
MRTRCFETRVFETPFAAFYAGGKANDRSLPTFRQVAALLGSPSPLCGDPTCLQRVGRAHKATGLGAAAQCRQSAAQPRRSLVAPERPLGRRECRFTAGRVEMRAISVKAHHEVFAATRRTLKQGSEPPMT